MFVTSDGLDTAVLKRHVLPTALVMELAHLDGALVHWAGAVPIVRCPPTRVAPTDAVELAFVTRGAVSATAVVVARTARSPCVPTNASAMANA